ncbi:MAG: sec-independent translocase [Nocardioides sp.]|uniref:sec-independent translocase n=1 Tax=Nocardioides sp. TaxID=35761 RepID=UPI003EFFC648
MFGVGLGELAVIALIVVLVMGPEKLPEFARQAAVFLRKAKEMANSTRDDIRSELGPEYADLELRDLDPRTFVRKQINEAMQNLDAEEKAAKELPEGVAPPYDTEAT